VTGGLVDATNYLLTESGMTRGRSHSGDIHGQPPQRPVRGPTLPPLPRRRLPHDLMEDIPDYIPDGDEDWAATTIQARSRGYLVRWPPEAPVAIYPQPPTRAQNVLNSALNLGDAVGAGANSALAALQQANIAGGRYFTPRGGRNPDPPYLSGAFDAVSGSVNRFVCNVTRRLVEKKNYLLTESGMTRGPFMCLCIVLLVENSLLQYLDVLFISLFVLFYLLFVMNPHKSFISYYS